MFGTSVFQGRAIGPAKSSSVERLGSCALKHRGAMGYDKRRNFSQDGPARQVYRSLTFNSGT